MIRNVFGISSSRVADARVITVEPQVIVAIIALVGVVLTQWFLHRRWTAEQDAKRTDLLASIAKQQRDESEKQTKERRQEQAEILNRMAEQSSTIIDDALKIAAIHQQDAEGARQLAIENARNHTECRQEVANLAGKVEELRARVIETERTSGREAAVSQWHQDVKHMTITALAASEGTTGLAVSCAKKCTCHAFDPMLDVLEGYTPRLEKIVEENKRLFTPLEDSKEN